MGFARTFVELNYDSGVAVAYLFFGSNKKNFIRVKRAKGLVSVEKRINTEITPIANNIVSDPEQSETTACVMEIVYDCPKIEVFVNNFKKGFRRKCAISNSSEIIRKVAFDYSEKIF